MLIVLIQIIGTWLDKILSSVFVPILVTLITNYVIRKIEKRDINSKILKKSKNSTLSKNLESGKVISPKESLNNITPIQLGEHVLSGKKKVRLSTAKKSI